MAKILELQLQISPSNEYSELISFRIFKSILFIYFLTPQTFCVGVQLVNSVVVVSGEQRRASVISLRIGWFDFLAVQETLKSLLQHHNSKASILQLSTFFMVQLSHPYLTTGKTIALTIQTFVSKVISLLFTMLSRFVIALLPRSKCLLIL